MSDKRDAAVAEAASLRIKLNRDLHAVERLYADLHWQAEATPVDRDGMPGGRALNMLAPASNLWDWQASYDAAESEIWDDPNRSWSEFVDYFDDQVESESHPLYVLDSWVRIVREERDQPTSLRSTVSRCVDYLLANVDWMLRLDAYDEPEWPEVYDFADELRALVSAMENVLHAGRRSDRIRATCIHCDKAPRLIRRWTSSEDRDYWYCPECHHPYDRDGVTRALHHRLFSEGADRWVRIDVARDVAEVDRRTWWSWRDRMQMKACCNLQTHAVMVWWPDVRTLVEELKERRAKRRGA